MRVKHVPSGLTVRCQQERSQMRNKGVWGGGPEILALVNHLQRPLLPRPLHRLPRRRLEPRVVRRRPHASLAQPAYERPRKGLGKVSERSRKGRHGTPRREGG